MEAKIDPATSEQLAALEASINQLKIKAAEAVRQIHAKIAADSAKLADSVRLFKAGLPDKLTTLAMNGWFIYGFRTPSQAIYPIASMFETGRVNRGNQVMCSHFNDVAPDIEADLTKRFSKRAVILKRAFEAHKAGNYELSIPVLLAQADGIARDTIGQNIPKFSVYTQFEPKKKEIRKAIDEFACEALLGSEILDVLLIKMPLNASEGDVELIKGVLNRNQILHGVDTDYATLTNSCRAISWLDYVSYFHKLSSKRKNKLNQRGSGGRGQ